MVQADLMDDTKRTNRQVDHISVPVLRWTLLDLPGVSLKNSLNKCWFHAGLHLLSAIPNLRSLCLLPPQDLSMFERRFLNAVRAIFHTRRSADVGLFFPLVRDFCGVNNRYGQVAVPDFIEYLCARSPTLSPVVKLGFTTQLQCSKCQWVSQRMCNDVSLKHIPPGRDQVTLSDLVDYNSNVVLTDTDAVFRGHCNLKTSHTLSRDYNPDLFLMEVVRVTESSRNTWVKNNASLSFPVTDLILPGFSRSYRVSTCHHRGSLNGGHWLTKRSTNHGWFDSDDLKAKNLRVTDNSVTIILVIAEDKL